MFERSTRPPKESPIGSYKLDVISLPEECDWEKFLPREFQYIFARSPESKEKIRAILADGKAVGVRTILRTPENILRAVHTISVYSQHNYIITWLPEFLKNKHRPHASAEDIMRAKEHGEDLEAAIELISKDRLRFKKLVLIDEENIGIKDEEKRLMTELSELMYPVAVDYAVFRVIADNARERTKIAQAIIKALLFVGPLAHILEKYAAGFGKVFAASADDLIAESAEIMALRGSGFSWRELVKRGRILVPVFILATWGAFSVEGLLQEGKLVLAGVVFGFSAVALSLTTAIQSIFMYKKNAYKLKDEGKISSALVTPIWKLAIIQDFTNPARLGLLLGAGMAPIMGAIGSVLHLMHNGWVLAAIGSTESIVAGLVVFSATYINEFRFRRKLQKSILATRGA